MRVIVSDLTKVYRGGVRALNGIELDIPPGMFGLLGPNGAGKTTLMRILAGILRPTRGVCRIGDYDGSTERGRTEIKRILGYLPQDLGMYPDLSAWEFLDYIGILKGMDDRQTRRRRVDMLLETVALTAVARRKLKTFSGGMKRRVGIAQALLNDPRLLIVDEPTSGLDPEERIRFRNLLAELAGERTVLLSTHIVEDIAQTCENVAVLNGGRVAFRGTIAEMIEAARGKVWLVSAPGSAKLEGDLSVVATVRQGTTTQYRVVSECRPSMTGGETAQIEPRLEESYVWLMRESRVAEAVGTA